jgi:DNA polymerase
VICAPPGFDLICADYSGVEARGLLWFAGDDESLEIFRRAKGQPGIYREMAGEIYGVDPASIDKETIEGGEQRQIGKKSILALGYGMGWRLFMRTCADDGVLVTEEFARHVVNTYRTRFASVPEAWKAVEKAAKRALANPGTIHKAFKVEYAKRGDFLYCRLPSGRKLAYYHPTLEDDFTPWGDPTQKLTYMSTDSSGKFSRTETYGGKLIENIIQALCRDLEAAAIVRVDQGNNPYGVIMHTHDEIVAEVAEGEGSIEEFENLISVLPKWATGFPLTAEGWRGKRYRK